MKGMEELCDLLKEMADSTGSHGETDSANQTSVCTQLLLQCQPLLSVYSRVLETHVARSLALHRTLGKMLSVMLAVFTQLMLKVCSCVSSSLPESIWNVRYCSILR